MLLTIQKSIFFKIKYAIKKVRTYNEMACREEERTKLDEKFVQQFLINGSHPTETLLFPTGQYNISIKVFFLNKSIFLYFLSQGIL